jgi:hypothetical protein
MNRKNDVLQVIDDMGVLYMGFALGSSIVLIGSSYLHPGDYHYRIVLNWFEVKICILGAMVSSYVVYVCGKMYIDLHSTANGVRKEIMYQLGLAMVASLSTLGFMYLLFDWLTKSQYAVLSPGIGIQWSLWEYHSQRILNCLMVDTFFDMLILRHLRLSHGGRMPKCGRVAVMNGWMTTEQVQLVLLNQENERRRTLKKYLKKRRLEKISELKRRYKWLI